jgi:thiol-disulfide isomerase/thioredoxin
MPGEKVSFTYNPTGSDLEGKSFDVIAYLFEGDVPKALDVEFQKQGATYVGMVKTTADTKALLLSLINEEEGLSDNNDDTGWKTLMHKENRLDPVQGAYAAKAMIYYSWNRLANIKRSEEKAFNLLKREFKTYPDSWNWNNQNLLPSYARLAKSQKDEEAMSEVRATVTRLTGNKKASEDDLAKASTLSNMLGDTEQANSIQARMKKKYPNGKAAKSELINSFYEAKEVDAKIAIFDKVKKNYGKDEGISNTLNQFASSIAGSYAKQNDWANFEKYLSLVTDRSNKASTLNNIAWDMSGESIEAESKDLEKAKAFSAMSLELLKEEMKHPDEKPAYYTAKQWTKIKKGSFSMYADTYALLTFKAGNAQEALEYQQIACEGYHWKEGEMNERYCVYSEKAKGGKEAEKLLEKLIADGSATGKMMEQHKRLFLANNTVETAYEKVIVSLEQKATDKVKQELSKKMIEKDAPDFRLLNLKGEEVSLSGLKGKVVVLDFWATWCGPCKASFPGMQKAVDNFADNKDVVFLFVDTWERGENKLKNASDFVESNKYTFNVLLDEKDEVVAKYGVEGIPTKFVVDKAGKIRFRSSGYGGNEEELVKEITLMIEMAGGSAPSKLTGAP